jgi:hypothetical protein
MKKGILDSPVVTPVGLLAQREDEMYFVRVPSSRTTRLDRGRDGRCAPRTGEGPEHG